MEQTVVNRTIDKSVKVNQKGDFSLETQWEKRKKIHNSSLLAMFEEFNAANLGTRSQGDFDICGMCEGTHGFSYHKFKC